MDITRDYSSITQEDSGEPPDKTNARKITRKNYTTREEETMPILEEQTLSSPITTQPPAQPQFSYAVCALCSLFGLGSWLTVNALYTQLPILVEILPEGWTLPSYMSLIVQLANIAPLVYICIRKYKMISDSTLISGFLILGAISSALMCLLFSEFMTFLGEQRSLFLFIFYFLMSMVGCVSSVLFIPFANRLPDIYLIPFFLGEGLSSFVPSIFSSVQGIGDIVCVNKTLKNGAFAQVEARMEPRFGVDTFSFITTVLMVISALSFVSLNRIPRYKMLQMSPRMRHKDEYYNGAPKISKLCFILLLFFQLILTFFSNGFLTSVQSFSCMPYGQDVYHWAVNLSQILNTLTYCAVFCVRTYLPRLKLPKFPLIGACSVVAFPMISYELWTAFSRPPPFMDSIYGAALIIITWSLGTSITSYMKLIIAGILRHQTTNSLFYFGIATQLGSAMGSLTAFYLVNTTDLLREMHPASPCK